MLPELSARSGLESFCQVQERLGIELFLGLGVSVVAPMILAWVGKTVAPESRAMAISRVVFLCYSGFFLGPPTLGLLAQLFGLPIAFSVLASLLAMISVVLVPWMRKSAG